MNINFIVDSINNIFNTRELASILWLLILIAYLFSKKLKLEHFKPVFKAFLSKKLIPIWMFFIIYIGSMLLLLRKLNFWDISYLKDTLYWFLGTAIILLFKINDALQNEKQFFKNIIVNTFKFLIILEFIVHPYTFPFFIEIFLIPIIFFVVSMYTISEYNEELVYIKKYLATLLSIIGLIILAFSIYESIVNFKAHLKYETFKAFILPVLLTLLYIPFLYFIAVLFGYDSIFRRINIYFDDKKYARCVKFQIVKYAGFLLYRLNRVMNNNVLKLRGLSSKKEINKILRKGKYVNNQRLPENKQEQIYWNLVEAEDMAHVEADIKYPIADYQITEGFTFINSRKIIIGGKSVPPNSEILITGRNISNKMENNPDYFAKARNQKKRTIAEGEMSNLFLLNQGFNLVEINLDNNSKYAHKLSRKYKEKIMQKYNLSDEGATEILYKGSQENFPIPTLLSIDDYLEKKNG